MPAADEIEPAPPKIIDPVPAWLLPAALAVMVTEPALSAVRAALIFMLSALRTTLTPVSPVAVFKLKASVIVMKSKASNVIVLPPVTPPRVPVASLTLKLSASPVSSANNSLSSVPPTKPSIAALPPTELSAAFEKVMLSGSNRTSPPLPFSALRSIVPSKPSERLPDTSTKPPSPD